MKKEIYDVIGIGFGPANIAVAIATEELQYKGKMIFLEKNETAVWQKEMLFEGSDIQNHPLRDLVSPVNPRSKYTFTNFLFEKGRLFEYLNLGMLLPFRVEYNQYIEWVAKHFEHLVKYNTSIESISLESLDDEMLYKIISSDKTYYAKSLVVGTGRTPNIPHEFQSVKSDRIIHLTKYLSTIKNLDKQKINKVLVVGGSQSAVEIILNVSSAFPDAEVHGLTKNFGYRMKDVSPFTGEVYFPEFVDIFYNADPATKRRLMKDLHHTNYSATDLDILDQLYRTIYQQKILNKQKIFIHRSGDLNSVLQDDKITVNFTSIEQGHASLKDIDLVILATGFKNIGTGASQERIPGIFKGLESYLELNEDGCMDAYPNYEIKMTNAAKNNKCFMNGFCESSHGMGDAGSFSLLSIRSRMIVESLKNTPITKENKYILDYEI